MLEERAGCVWHSDVSEDTQTWSSLKKNNNLLFALTSREHLNKGFVLMNIVCRTWDGIVIKCIFAVLMAVDIASFCCLAFICFYLMVFVYF